jgi:hypothetical protein
VNGSIIVYSLLPGPGDAYQLSLIDSEVDAVVEAVTIASFGDIVAPGSSVSAVELLADGSLLVIGSEVDWKPDQSGERELESWSFMLRVLDPTGEGLSALPRVQR